LILSEIGLDALRNGQLAQARSLDWQIRAAFAGGCAGAFVFAWTDEWHRAGEEVDDWAFGITDRERRPKPALADVRTAYAEVPFADRPWPRISVVVCSYNGSRTIRDCLDGLSRVDYPNFEVIVVDDGSTDGTADIARGYDVRLIRTENRGLSSARNTGLEAASGEMVAYLDDDAWPDPHWLKYVAATFEATDHAGVGGPNLPPPGDGPIADCVANAPGGPVHVLLTDREAEHIPGCNMAFRRASLEAIGGFDLQFRTAGDDVDVCWRLRERGWTIGFHPAAVVWHHRRNSLRAYWKQQLGYGKAEALLRRKWPEKYNGAGHLTWAGRIYSRGLTRPLLRAGRIYHGTWGAAPFQRLYQPAPSTLGSLPLMPEWFLSLPILATLSALTAFWRPLVLSRPILAVAALVSLAQAWASTGQACFTSAPPARSSLRRLGLRVLTALLHILHPLAQLCGRLQGGSAPGLRGGRGSFPWPRVLGRWTERGEPAEQRLQRLGQTLRAVGACVHQGGDWDRWDLEVQAGQLGAVRLILAVEDHGAGRQLVRWRWWPSASPVVLAVALVLAELSLVAGLDGARFVAGIFGAAAGWLVFRVFRQCGAAAAAVQRAVREGA
jgi:GT2 family glycosyltransferase